MLFLLVASSSFQPSSFASTQSGVVIRDEGTNLNFPNSITFKASIESKDWLDRVILEYGVDKLTCGTVVAEAFPSFNPVSTSTEVSWTWDMRKSGSEPPGSRLWYRWRVTDKSGASALSDKRTVLWLDDKHEWYSLTKEKITFHWYGGEFATAQELLDSASDSLRRLSEATGVKLDAPVDMYIYANTADMKEAVLYEPNWTGGQAFPASSIVIIGISTEQVDWGKKTEAHELTHVLVGHLVFSCTASVPTWLNEGIAVYGEGGPDEESMARLESAIKEDKLISVRALSGGFSEHPDRADLSYAESYSLVNYLITEHGREKLLKLFGNLREGVKLEDAVRDAYGFGLDGLEDGWRASVDAKPRVAAGTTPSPTLAATAVPTYRPSSAAPVAPTVNTTPGPDVTPVPNGNPNPNSGATTSTPQERSLLLGIIIAVTGVFIFATIALYLRHRMRLAEA